MLKLRKKLTAAFLIASIFIGQSTMSADEPEAAPPADGETAAAENPEADEPALNTDLPVRTDADLLKQAELYAENEFFRLYVVDKYAYTGGGEEKKGKGERGLDVRRRSQGERLYMVVVAD